MPTADTDMTEDVRRLFELLPTQKQVAAAARVEQQTVSTWKKRIADRKPVLIRQAETVAAIRDYLLQEDARSPGFARGVRVAIDEARKALDDLEARLTTTPTSTAGPSSTTGGEPDGQRSRKRSAVTRVEAVSEKDPHTKKRPA